MKVSCFVTDIINTTNTNANANYYYKIITCLMVVTTIIAAGSAKADRVDQYWENYWKQPDVANINDVSNIRYLRFSAGLSSPKKPEGDFGGKLKRAEVYEAEMGYSLIGNMKLGLNLSYRGKFKNEFSTITSYPGLSEEPDETIKDNFNFKTKSYAAMLVTSYDLINFGSFTPYLMGGVGMSHNETKGNAIEVVGDSDPENYVLLTGKKNNFAYKLGTGVKFNLSPNFALDLYYQYVDLGKINSGRVATGPITVGINPKVAKLRTHEVLLGAAFYF